jgi:hypothetical protein
VDIVFLADPIPAFFPSSLTMESSSRGAVLQPLADFTYQQNLCGYDPKTGQFSETVAGEGNTGLYYMRSTTTIQSFLMAVLDRQAEEMITP